MKSKLLLLVLVAAALGYVLGTEKGRAQRDLVIVKVRERRGGAAASDSVESPEETIDVTEAVVDEAADVVETVGSGTN